MARRPARKARSTRRVARVARRSPARRTAVRSSARKTRAPARRVSARRAKPQTIKIVVEQPGPTLARPDISEDQLVSSKIEKGKRRAKL